MREARAGCIILVHHSLRFSLFLLFPFFLLSFLTSSLRHRPQLLAAKLNAAFQVLSAACRCRVGANQVRVVPGLASASVPAPSHPRLCPARGAVRNDQLMVDRCGAAAYLQCCTGKQAGLVRCCRAVSIPTSSDNSISILETASIRVQLQSPDDGSLPEQSRPCSAQSGSSDGCSPVPKPAARGPALTLPRTSFIRERILQSRLRSPCAVIFRGRRQSFMQNIRWKPSGGILLIRCSFMRLGLLAGPRTQRVSPAGFMTLFVCIPSSGCSTSVPSPCRSRELLRLPAEPDFVPA